MSTKPVFVDYETTLNAAFANTVATTVWDALGEATTPAEALAFLNGVPETDQGATPVVRIEGQWVPLGPDEKGPHNDLLSRDAEDAHPIEAITGLDTTLSGLSASIGALGNHAGLVNRDAADSHPTAAITGLDVALSGLGSDVATLEDDVATLQDQVAEVLLSVADYGAIGDGTTDDSAAFQAAIDAAAALGNRSVYVPFTAAGYAISQITLKENTRLYSDVTGYRRAGSWDAISGLGEVAWIKSVGTVNTPTVIMRDRSTVDGLMFVDPRQKWELTSASDSWNATQYAIQLGDSSDTGVVGAVVSNCVFHGHTKFITQYKAGDGTTGGIANLMLLNLTGAVLDIGIEILRTGDVCWCYNVQFNANALNGILTGNTDYFYQKMANTSVHYRLGDADGFNIIGGQHMHFKHVIKFVCNAYTGDTNGGGGTRIMNCGIDVGHIPFYVDGRSQNDIGFVCANCFILPLYYIAGDTQAVLVVDGTTEAVDEFKAHFTNINVAEGSTNSYSTPNTSVYFGTNTVKAPDYFVRFDGTLGSEVSNCFVTVASSRIRCDAVSNLDAANTSGNHVLTSGCVFYDSITTPGASDHVSGEGAIFRSVGGNAGQARGFEILTGTKRRWLIRADGTSESGSDAGSDLVITAYDDSGAQIANALTITRSNQSIILGPTTPVAGQRVQTGGDTLRIPLAKTPASSSATAAAGEICWNSSYLYVAVGTNSWKRIALSTF